MKKKALSKREKALIVFLILLILGAVYYFFVQVPVSEGMELAQEQMENAQMNIEILSAKAISKHSMEQELEERKKINGVQEIPEFDNLPTEISFLNSILGLTKDYSMTMSTAFPDAEGSDKVVRRTAQISFVADSYQAAKKAVNLLENGQHLSSVSELSMKPEDKYSRNLLTGPVRVDLKITFFERTV